MISFFVPGIPKPRGSKRAFVITPKGGGKPRAIITDDCKGSGDWMGDVKRGGMEARTGDYPLIGPVKITLDFSMPRPKNHYRANGAPSTKAVIHHTNKPDIDKLSRAVLDALKSVCWLDDSQICEKWAIKHYAGNPGVRVIIEECVEKVE